MKRARRQSGVALLAVVTLLLVVGAYVFIGSLDGGATRVERERSTHAALLKAKEALIGYAAADSNRPGELPCPDVNDDGKLILGEDFSGGGVCTSLIGRLPFATLDLPDLRDDAGERLWYAVSGDFRAGASVPLNSDTAYRSGNVSLSVNGLQPATNLVAMVFAPGAALQRSGASAIQNRSCSGGACDAAGKCTSSPASSTAKCNAVNYLDFAGGEDNADANRVFVTADKSDSFNDRLLPIHSDEIMWLVEKRAGREFAQKLRDHYDAWQGAPDVSAGSRKGFYPWAAPLNDPTLMQPGTNGTTNGMLPLNAGSVLWNAPVASLGLCAGADTAQIVCTAFSALGAVISISGRVRNLGTAFLDPPTAANVTVAGVVLGQTVTWTLNAAQNALDFNYSATILGLVVITARAPTQTAWVGASWLTTNQWHHLAHYAVSPGYGLTGANTCALPGPPQCVSVNAAGAHAALVMAGRALPGKSQRPITLLPADVTEFLEGTNQAPANLVFERQLKAASFNDLPVVVRP